MGAQPRRDSACGGDRAKLRELRFPVEPIAGLRLEGRRPVGAHPAAVPQRRFDELLLGGRAGRAHGGEDAAAGLVELEIVGARGAERELVDAIAGEARVRVAVDQAGHGAEPARVELVDLAVQRRQILHPADGLDDAVPAQDVRGFENVDLAEGRAAKRRIVSGGCRELAEVANEQPRHVDALGRSSSVARATSSASSYPASA